MGVGKKHDSNSPAHAQLGVYSDLSRTRTGEAVSHSIHAMAASSFLPSACVYCNAVGPQSLLTVFGNTPHVSTRCCSNIQDFSTPLLNSLPSSHLFVSLSAPALVCLFFLHSSSPPAPPLLFLEPVANKVRGWGGGGGRKKHSQYKSICADGF